MNLTQTIIGMASGVVPLVPIVIGLTQWVKVTLNTSDGRILNACSMLFGVVLGVAFMVAQQVPQGFTDWFIVVIYGLVLGLTASGLFKVGLEMARKTNTPAGSELLPSELSKVNAPH